MNGFVKETVKIGDQGSKTSYVVGMHMSQDIINIFNGSQVQFVIKHIKHGLSAVNKIKRFSGKHVCSRILKGRIKSAAFSGKI